MRFHRVYVKEVLQFMLDLAMLSDLGISTDMSDNFLYVSEDEYRLIKVVYNKDILHLYGNIEYFNNNITELPDNLTVTGRLNIRNTLIKELPKNLTISRDLDIRDTKICKIPDCLTVGGRILYNQKQFMLGW